MEQDSTIAALATPHGSGALAVIRVSGPNALPVVKALVDDGERFEAAPPRAVRLYLLRAPSGENIDHATAIKYPAPHSFTGENAAEILCHGGTIVVERILEALIDAGAVYARRGEFTRRAFLNGKIELAEAESIERIVSSRTLAQHRNAVECYFGAYRGKLSEWRKGLERILVETETRIEFGEEDDVRQRHGGENVQDMVRALRKSAEEQLVLWRVFGKKQGGIQVAFVGCPNVGKSTLLNQVLGYERSIVFPEEGTTRDAVSEWVSWHGLDIKFVDCAGLRHSGEGVEMLGVKRSWGIIEESDYVVLVTVGGREWSDEEEEILNRRKERGGVLCVVNKVDIEEPGERAVRFSRAGIPHICTSAINPERRQEAITFLSRELELNREDIQHDTIICTRRQESLVRRLVEELREMEGVEGEEIIAFHGRRALALLDEFVGRTSSNMILDAIFDQFCIGK